MEFVISDTSSQFITDWEIVDLLGRVYVDAGFSAPDEAKVVFEPQAVRERGLLFTARETDTAKLAGMIILVPPDSSARRLAQENEAEIHLLGVLPEYRGNGLGRQLVEAAIESAVHNGYSRLLLWTQTSMHTAQSIYESLGFTYIDHMTKNGRDFKIYEKSFQA